MASYAESSKVSIEEVQFLDLSLVSERDTFFSLGTHPEGGDGLPSTIGSGSAGGPGMMTTGAGSVVVVVGGPGGGASVVGTILGGTTQTPSSLHFLK